ncbi:hypothetical protein [Reichenbachiella sp.]|uniref:hypothetical protein n=1 Tax=Reichenbachiella sp. TaxID=2184521 RepID=UPI003B5B3418
MNFKLILKRTSFYLFILNIALLGCEYSYDENFHHVEIGEPDQIIAEFGNPEDTLYLRKSGNIYYNFLNDLPDIVGYALYFDDSLLVDGTYRPNRNYINPYQLPVGYHILKLELYEKTNSNSLADQLGAEVFVHSFEQVVLIDNQILEPLEITNTSVTNEGYLKIEWEEYTGYKFEKYVVSTMGSEYEIVDSKTNYIILPNYPGGEIFFVLDLLAKGETENTQYFYWHDFNFTATIQKNNSIKLLWDESPFTATQNFLITISDNLTELVEPAEFSFSSSDFGLDHVVSIPTSFPYNLNIEVRSESGTNGHQYSVIGQFDHKYTLQSDHLEGRNYDYNEYYYHKMYFFNSQYNTISVWHDADKYISSTSGSIKNYRLDNQEGIAYLPLQVEVSPNGSQLARITTKSLRRGIDIYKYDSYSLEQSDHYEIIVPEDSSYFLKNFCISNDNILFLSIPILGPDKYVLYSLDSESILTEGFLSISSQDILRLTNNGDYLILNDTKYAPVSKGGSPVWVTSPNIGVQSTKRNIGISYSNPSISLNHLDGSAIADVLIENREVLWVYENGADHWAILTMDIEGKYLFEVYSFDNPSEQVAQIVINNNSVEDYKYFTFTENYLLIPKLLLSHFIEFDF